MTVDGRLAGAGAFRHGVDRKARHSVFGEDVQRGLKNADPGALAAPRRLSRCAALSAEACRPLRHRNDIVHLSVKRKRFDQDRRTSLMKEPARSHPPPDLRQRVAGPLFRVIGPLVRLAVRRGLAGPNILLTVRGRTTGRPRGTPVAMWEF